MIAVKSGGPMETVVHGATGFLCPPDEDGGGSLLVGAEVCASSF